jgi:hypothetical protein
LTNYEFIYKTDPKGRFGADIAAAPNGDDYDSKAEKIKENYQGKGKSFNKD